MQRFWLSMGVLVGLLLCMGVGRTANAQGASGSLQAAMDQMAASVAAGQRAIAPVCTIRQPPQDRMSCVLTLEALREYVFVGASIGGVKEMALIAYDPEGERVFKEAPGRPSLHHVYRTEKGGRFSIDLIIDEGEGEAGLRVYTSANAIVVRSSPPGGSRHKRAKSRSERKETPQIPSSNLKPGANAWRDFPRRS